jgi:biuret amidohydrolase
MPLDLAALVSPRHTAVVTSEIQRGVIGDLSALPELAQQGREILPNVARLVEGARAAGVEVIHCIAERRADDKGMNRNARMFAYMARAEPKLLPGSPAT